MNLHLSRTPRVTLMLTYFRHVDSIALPPDWAGDLTSLKQEA